jgi:two-component system invasion response regulator UvrY
MITVQVVDDHELVRTAFRYLLEGGRFSVVAESGDGREAIADYLRCRPDIVLMDIGMGRMSGLDAMRHILARDPEARIIMLSMQGQEAAERAMRAGAKGFLSKHGAASELHAAIEKVVQGRSYIDQQTAQQIAINQLAGDQGLLSALSPREYEIFVLLARGTAVNRIAEDCCLSPKTVRSHKSRIMRKLGLSNTVEFVRLAIKAGVVD